MVSRPCPATIERAQRDVGARSSRRLVWVGGRRLGRAASRLALVSSRPTGPCVRFSRLAAQFLALVADAIYRRCDSASLAKGETMLWPSSGAVGNG